MQAPELARQGLAKYIPALDWLPKYQSAWLRADLLAGWVAAAVVIPQAMAYASIAGLPVQVGLYVALAPMLVYALLGTSRPLSVSSTSTISMMVATTLAMVAGGGNSEEYIIPASLVTVALGILATALLNLEAAGVELVGAIPPGLPRLKLPEWSLFVDLWPAAMGIALMSFVESIASARAFLKHGDHPVDADQELFALGMANLAGGFTQAYPAGGGTSQTAVNDQAGARSQVAEIVTVAAVLVTLQFLAPLIGLMPQATLGALVLVAAASMVKLGEFRKLARFRRIELVWALVSFLGVVVLGTLVGILVAVSISMLVLIYLANHPPVYAMGRKPGEGVFLPLPDHPDGETLPGLLILRSEGILPAHRAPLSVFGC